MLKYNLSSIVAGVSFQYLVSKLSLYIFSKSAVCFHFQVSYLFTIFADYFVSVSDDVAKTFFFGLFSAELWAPKAAYLLPAENQNWTQNLEKSL